MKQLTKEDISKICMYMRTIDFLKSNTEIMEADVNLKQQFIIISEKVRQIFDILTIEQCDNLLDEHKLHLLTAKETDIKDLIPQKLLNDLS